jgi:hypothetical protein
MRFNILVLACMVALAVSAPSNKAGSKQAEGLSPFAQLSVDQRKCVVAKIAANPAILVSVYYHTYKIDNHLALEHKQSFNFEQLPRIRI